MIKLLFIKKSHLPNKKFDATFERDGRKKTISFGASGMSDFTKHHSDERKKLYDARHKPSENWNDPMTAGALSKYVLWNKPTLQASISDYKKRFNL